MTSLDIRQKAKSKHDEGQAILKTAETEARSLTAEEREKAQALAAEVKGLTAEADLRDQYSSFGSGNFGPLPHEDAKNAGKHVYKYSRHVSLYAQDKKIDGVEAETSDELAKRCKGLQAPSGGIYVPWNARVENRAAPTVVTPSVTTAQTTGVQFTQYDPSVIDILRPLTVLGQAGARFIPNITGAKYHMPKKTAKTSAYWVPEGEAPNKSGTSHGSVVLTGKHLAANATISFEASLTSGIDSEADLVKDLFSEMFIEIENAAFNGLIANGAPRGLLKTTGVNAMSFKAGSGGAAATYKTLLDFVKAIKKQNVRSPLTWITTPDAWAHLKQVPKISGDGYQGFLWDDSNAICGYPALMSNLVPADNVDSTDSGLSTIVLGAWQHLVIGLWGGAYLIKDEKSSFGSGAVNFGIHQMIDVGVEYAEAFSIANDLKTV